MSTGYLERQRSRAQVAAECREAAHSYEDYALAAEGIGNDAVARHFRLLAAQRRERARQLELHS